MSSHPLRIGLIDMNNGHANQAIRSFRGLIGTFLERARQTNPSLVAAIVHVEPRNRADLPPANCDLYLSTGGPDSPLDGIKESWYVDYQRFLDGIVGEQLRRGDEARAAFLVCYSFEIAVAHFAIAALEPRPRKFGIMPIYPTEEGMADDMLKVFGDRFFAWEHRSWQATGLDEGKLAKFGGRLLARESRDGVSKGPGLMAFHFAPGIEGTIFHPEADRPGVLNWIERPEQQQAVRDAYGEVVYQRMRKTIDDPQRLARTYSLLLPGWLQRRFNALAPSRGWKPIDPPSYDVHTYEHPAESQA
jgi:hypothetical protein